MQEHHHTRTTPGEPLAPEIVPHAVQPEPGAHAQADNINIQWLGLMVTGFVIGLAVIIVALQAWFYSAGAREVDVKWRPDPVLESLVRQYGHDLHDPADFNPRLAGAKEANLRRIPIDQAIEKTVQQYAAKPQEVERK